ncbi:MAG: S8 family peptidase [Eubacteriales bacterium]|nr:S8 family peptidase [Eubacteriales bacterium]
MNQKLDTSLSLSLRLSEEERMKSTLLRTGYQRDGKLWRLILLYEGSLEEVSRELSFFAIPLLGNFAIIEIAETKLPALLEYPQVLYLELPGPLYQEEITGMGASCFSKRPFSPENDSDGTLTGDGTAVAILDSGVDFRHPDFCTPEGRSRILFYWDQSLPYDGSNRYRLGHIFTEEELSLLLSGAAPSGAVAPSPDSSGHGTHVAGICAGNGRASGGRNHGAAPMASLLVVKLKNDASSVFTDYANLMLAVDFVVRCANELEMPLSVNISYGSNDGAHNGSSLVERFLSEVSFFGKNVVVAATGNEGLSRRHSRVTVNPGTSRLIPFRISPGEQSMYLQLWKPYAETFSYGLFLPDGKEELIVPGTPGLSRFNREDMQLFFFINEPGPYQPLQEVFLVLLPDTGRQSLASGQWQLRILSGEKQSVPVDLWLPSREATGQATGFLEPSAYGTLTIPSTAKNVISVGGYDSSLDVFASFSGRGFEFSQPSAPNLCAPAVNILSTAPGGGYTVRTGTSMAAPFVTGAASLLMQYGIVNGQDPFLYGEKIKALLQKGARPLPGFSVYPNPSAGWGALCLKDSLPSGILSPADSVSQNVP